MTTNKKIETMMREAGINPALPHLIFRAEEGVVFASKRMCILLNTFDEKLFQQSQKRVSKIWPFSNQEDAGPRIFSKLINSAPVKIEAQSNLQNYLLESFRLRDGSVVLVAKLQRKGDLLNDKSSRQELFRTLAHELRTSAMALDGYVLMLKDLDREQDTSMAKKMRADVHERLQELTKRFSKNVLLLDSLRDQLNSDDKDRNAA